MKKILVSLMVSLSLVFGSVAGACPCDHANGKKCEHACKGEACKGCAKKGGDEKKKETKTEVPPK